MRERGEKEGGEKEGREERGGERGGRRGGRKGEEEKGGKFDEQLHVHYDRKLGGRPSTRPGTVTAMYLLTFDPTNIILPEFPEWLQSVSREVS